MAWNQFIHPPGYESWQEYDRGFYDGQHKMYLACNDYKQRLLEALHQYGDDNPFPDMNDPEKIADQMINIFDKLQTRLNTQAQEILELRASVEELQHLIVSLTEQRGGNKSRKLIDTGP